MNLVLAKYLIPRDKVMLLAISFDLHFAVAMFGLNINTCKSAARVSQCLSVTIWSSETHFNSV